MTRNTVAPAAGAPATTRNTVATATTRNSVATAAAAPTRNTVAMGASAETAATRLLLDLGYHIVERNFRCRAGELDLIARDRNALVFVEVRSRSDADHGHAAEMVDAHKQRQVARVASHYLAMRDPGFNYDEVRFDVIAITGGQAELLQDAFRP